MLISSRTHKITHKLDKSQTNNYGPNMRATEFVYFINSAYISCVEQICVEMTDRQKCCNQ